MEFFVDITVRLPPDLDEAEREELIETERQRGRELISDGAIAAIWRIPGALRNVSIWRADDATDLHRLLGSLPSYRYAEIAVTPLAVHPLNGGAEIV